MTGLKIEMFSCAGGMAEGFRRAGIHFDLAIDFESEHCDSYEANLGYRPVRMDVRDLLRMIRLGWSVDIDLLVADPPCTPWSRAGKRQGLEDERDMLHETCEIIRLLRPRRYLIGNVPGLDDSVNWHIVQKVIGDLSKQGYCVADYAALDAADYGVPQHRVRPFWFGHLDGPCWRPPAPTHGDPKLLTSHTLPGFEQLSSWVTCAQALGHLSPKDLGRPVRLRKRAQNSLQHGSVGERPARGVGTSNLSDGNVLLGSVTFNERHAPATLGAPAPTLAAKQRMQSGQVLIVTSCGAMPPEMPEHACVLPAGHEGAHESAAPLDRGKVRRKPRRKDVPQGERIYPADQPAPALTTKEDRVGSGLMLGTSTLTVEMHHPPSYHEPAKAVRAGDGQGANRALVLTDGEPTRRKRPPSTKGPMSQRSYPMDEPSPTIMADTDRATGNNVKLEWPWDRPSTTLQRDERIPPPGHHDENWDGGTRSMERAVILSEKAAAILQGFPEGWTFAGKSKRTRWSQIGQAMPPPLAHAVATSIVAQARASGLDLTDTATAEAIAK